MHRFLSGPDPSWNRIRPVLEPKLKIRLGTGPDPISHNQVKGTYVPETENLDPKYLLLDGYPEPKPICYENNKCTVLNLDLTTFRICQI
jgi:hypothetical protein